MSATLILQMHTNHNAEQHLNILEVVINTQRSHWFLTESMSVDHFWNKVPDLFYWTDSHENLTNVAVTLDLYVYAQIHDQCSLSWSACAIFALFPSLCELL